MCIFTYKEIGKYFLPGAKRKPFKILAKKQLSHPRTATYVLRKFQSKTPFMFQTVIDPLKSPAHTQVFISFSLVLRTAGSPKKYNHQIQRGHFIEAGSK